MKILFVVPYPLKRSPSQRFRFEQYFNILENKGHRYQVRSFYNNTAWNRLYLKGNTIWKVTDVFAGFLRRFCMLFSLHRYDIVFIHREAAPVGPPVFEWFIAKVARKKIIYDFDDAIWLTDKNEGAAGKIIRWRKKVKTIIRWSYKVSCGNHYLVAFAKRFNERVVFNPTTIDTSYHNTPIKKEKDDLIIGWTGSHSTLKYLNEILPAIRHIEERHANIKFRVIANQDPSLPLRSFEFVKWSEETEIRDLSVIDIGVMPLPNDEWSKGKCGFKLLQYMSLGIPSVASPVGANTNIITEGVEGLLCSTEQQWIDALEKLIQDPSLRTQMGKAGRIKVENNYSVASNTSTFCSLFDL